MRVRVREAPGIAPAGSARKPSAAFGKTFGPGLLWAAAAIGASHLVQSTRAGADAGFGLAWIVILALCLKYPFFEYGPRYAAATGESLVEGYARQGRWALWLYLLITVIGAVVVYVAVVLLTAFVVAHALGLDWSVTAMGTVVMAGCALLLAVGRFPALDWTIKAVLVLLTLSTLVSAAAVAPRAVGSEVTPWPLGDTTATVGFAFLLALIGWMPSGMDSSVWSSLWILAKDRTTRARTEVAAALLDFRIGYIGTGVIALAFITLGAGVMHASGQSFSPQGPVFSFQLVDLYADALGAWARPLVLVAVVTTMVSTTLTIMDGFPRAIARTAGVLRSSTPGTAEKNGGMYWATLLGLAVITIIVFTRFLSNLTTMVDFATTVSFVTAPVLGWLNLRAVTASQVPEAFRPGRTMRLVSWAGLAFLCGTGVVFFGLIFIG